MHLIKNFLKKKYVIIEMSNTMNGAKYQNAVQREKNRKA